MPFQVGYDPNRYLGPKRQQGDSLAQQCRNWTPAVIKLLGNIVANTDVDGLPANHKVSDQITAANILLDRGYGKAATIVEMNVHKTEGSIKLIPTSELERIAAGEEDAEYIAADAEYLPMDAPMDAEEQDV